MNKRVDSLNFIRIIGMTMILLFHAWLMYGFSIGQPWLDQLISIGAVFVTVFFMLSGFGLRKSNRDLSIHDFSGILRFYKKRILSIYPIFLLLTLVALIFQFRVMDSVSATLCRLPIQFSMLHILFGKDMHGFLFNDNCWYISALFVLYLLFPVLNSILNCVFTKLKTCGKLFFIFLLWVISIGIYFYLVYHTEYIFLDYYPNPFLRIPQFMIGMILADLSEDTCITKWLPTKTCALLTSVIVIALPLCLLSCKPYFIFETPLYDVLMVPCTVILFLCFANWHGANQLGAKPVVRWLSGLGLEIYLCQSFATLSLQFLNIGGNRDEILFILLTIIFAIIVNTFYTKPIIKMARK